MYLEKIKGPQDVKKLNSKELEVLAEEIREGLFNRLTQIGGHCGPNFGFVEATIAMHYVFNSPIDKFVFDVSHQTYPHKMLTGRAYGYIDNDRMEEISGYSAPYESEHDHFVIGHTSTSVSLACGLAKGRDLKGDKENVIAIIGDGSLSGGEALEALDYAGSELNSNLIIVVNDNQQSISKNYGGLYRNLEELRNGTAKTNLFTAFGLDYIYEPEGNNIGKLIEIFQKVKDIDHPIVVHINTVKGKGYKPAEENREDWHWTMPFNRETGKLKVKGGEDESYPTLTANHLLEKIKADSNVIVVLAGSPMNYTMEQRIEASKQLTDVGIAEENAIGIISGIAKQGCKPIFTTNASFIQRTYDQVSQDLCLNKNSGTIVLGFTSVWGLNDETHLGIFTISEFSHIPNLLILAPTNKQEYLSMLDWAVEQNEHPVMILMPGNGVIKDSREATDNYSKCINRFKVEQSGEKVAIIAVGDFYQIGEQSAKLIEEKLGFKPTLINPRFINDIDEECLDNLKGNHSMVITLEDGIVDGGFGQKIASYYGLSDMKVKNLGLKKLFYDRYDANVVLDELGITPEKITKLVEKNI